MPLNTCKTGDKPGYKWGNQGHCYTYEANNPNSRKEAKKKAIKQGIAIEGPKKFKEEITKKAELETEDMLITEEVFKENPQFDLKEYLK